MGTRRPGPIGCGRESRSVEDGTLARNFASTPGPLGACATRNLPTAAKPQPPRPRREPSAIAQLPALRRGAQGGEVQKLQRQLNARLMPAPKLAVDGIFGPITQRAVVYYQKAMSIDADGIVGKLTWYHLLKGDKATVRTPEPVAAHAHAGTPPAAAPMLAAPPATKPGVWEWPLEEKFAEALRRTAPKLDDSVREEFKALLTPGALAMMAGTLVVWAASHAFGVGAVVDVLLLLTGIVFLGIAAFDVAEDLGDFLLLTSTASSDTELEQASTHLSRAIAVMGVAAFMALLAKVAAKARVPRAGKPAAAASTEKQAPKLSASTPSLEARTPAARTLPKLENSRYGGVQVARVRQGSNEKVAVIGRSMDDAVEPYAKGLGKEGVNTETFNGNKISEAATAEWKALIKRYKPDPIPEDVVRESKMFQENRAWAQKLKDEGYTVIDVGNPTGKTPSPFYEMEKQILFGG